MITVIIVMFPFLLCFCSRLARGRSLRPWVGRLENSPVHAQGYRFSASHRPRAWSPRTTRSPAIPSMLTQFFRAWYSSTPDGPCLWSEYERSGRGATFEALKGVLTGDSSPNPTTDGGGVSREVWNPQGRLSRSERRHSAGWAGRGRTRVSPFAPRKSVSSLPSTGQHDVETRPWFRQRCGRANQRRPAVGFGENSPY
jgi:hypothetical protein